jgi:hypothetical protein
MANALGVTLNPVWSSLPTDDEDYYLLSSDEWVIVDKLNVATGKNFTSWSEYFQPSASYQGDQFSVLVGLRLVLLKLLKQLIS